MGEAEDRHRADPVVSTARTRTRPSRVDAEPGEDARGVQDAGLAVPAVDADGVQLEELAALVLVRVRRRRVAVVEVGEHRRVLGDAAQQVGELAERVRADRVRVVRARLVRAVVGDRHVEVVAPEVLHHGEQLALGPQRADDERPRHRHGLLPAVDRAGLEPRPDRADGGAVVRHGHPREERIHLRVRDQGRLQLPVDPPRQPETADVRERLRARSVRRTAQEMVACARHDVRRTGRRG